MSAMPETQDWDATLAKLNTDQGFDPGAADGEPAQEAQDAPQEQDAQPQDDQAPQEAAETPQEPATAPETPTDEVRLSKREVEEMRRQLASYGANIQQQRAEFDRRIQEAIQGQGPDIERKIADARREERRATLREQIGQISDPQLREQYRQTYDQQWRQEDDGLAAERARAEVAQVRQQAEAQTQQAQTLVERAQAQLVAANMPTFLEAYAPVMTGLIAQTLGQEVDAKDVQAFLTRPEIVKLAQAEAAKGPAAIDALGTHLTAIAALQIRDRAAEREKAAATNRERRDASGAGRGQGGANGGTPPVDLNQFKSSKTKAGDFDAMLRALSQDQGIETATRRR